MRVQLQTNDGAHVYCQFFGLLELNSAVSHAMATGEGTTFEDQYFRTSPRFETGADRYAWMNTSLFVARGRLRAGGGVHYEVLRVL